jgi:predicted AlkP superfamily phosphohydrolase/phosphomutase
MRHSRTQGFRIVVALIAVALSGCGDRPAEDGTRGTAALTPPRVLLIGLDGADLRMIDRLSTAGQIPNLSRLVRSGVSARLQTIANYSPIIWTSIATGVEPSKHNIMKFVEGKQPVTSTMRERPAFWNILTHYGRTVGVLAWWATFPAESVNGYIVSPYVIFGSPRLNRPQAVIERVWERPDPRSTFPPELHARIVNDMLGEADLESLDMSDVYADNAKTTNTAWVVARDQSYFNVAKSLMDTDPVETVAVYLQGIDITSHDFSRYVHGKNLNWKREPLVEASEVRKATERVDAMYARIDRMIGGLLAKTTEDTDVIVVSDHGWEYDGTGHHNLNPGILIAAGPSFQKDVRADDVSVLDVLPMMLTILEVPLSRDFDGRVPEELFVADFSFTTDRVEEYPIKAVGLHHDVDIESPKDRLMLERLRSLGYIE